MDIKGLEAAALSVRTLSIDAVQKANSGHPGLPLGCAEVGALIFGEILKNNPAQPHWLDRDRFVLSAGHGSAMLYSLLHLSGYNLTLDDIKQFRQLHSKTAGHPEYDVDCGIELTTGPLGQGFATAVGMAIAERFLASTFNTKQHRIINHFTYVLASDGDIMEGVAQEAASLAGHLGLNKLIVFYDSNKITIDGSTDLTFTEDVQKRFDAYGWHTARTSAYDFKKLLNLVDQAKKQDDKPTIIIMQSIIGKGSPNKAGTSQVHGAPLGEEEVKKTKQALGVPADSMFYISDKVKEYFKHKQEKGKTAFQEWEHQFAQWQQANPDLFKKCQGFFEDKAKPAIRYPEYKVGDKMATRAAGGEVMNAIAQSMANLVGGSADLASSNKTTLKDFGELQKATPTGRNICYGIREHAMAAVSNGIALHGGLRPFCATFFIFSDYLRPALRLSCLMKLPVIYVFTHDSIYVGEDGPTHQPIEQLASLRAVPRLMLYRPADAQEVVAAWQMALAYKDGPSAIMLTRQNLTVFPKDDKDWMQSIKKGAYIAKKTDGEPELVIVATGSEVNLALEVAKELNDKKVRVVSMPSRKLFLKQSPAYRDKLVPPGTRCVVIEAGVATGWEGLAGRDGLIFSIEQFGASGPANEVAAYLGFSVKNIVDKIGKLLP
jgi:transketolase